MSSQKVRPRRRRARRRYLLSPSKAAGYALSVALIFVCAAADAFGQALALGLLVGLVYARRNLLVVGGAYLAASVCFDLTVWTPLYAGIPVLVLWIFYFAHRRARRNVGVWASAGAGLICALPYAVIRAVLYGDYPAAALSFLLAGAVSLACSSFCYAVFVRGTITRLAPDEKIAAGIAAAALGYAACSCVAGGFSLAFALLPAAGLIISFAVGLPAGQVFAVMAGVGSALCTGQPYIAAFLVLAVSVGGWLLPLTRWSSAAGALAVYGVFAAWAGDYGFGWENAIAAGAGLAVFLALPQSALIGPAGGRGGRETAVTAVINRSRRETAARLSSVGKVFLDMADSLAGAVGGAELYTPERLASEVAKNYCGRCKNREGCFSALGGDTTSVLLPMANAVLARGRVTILDMPPFVTGRCSAMHNLVAVMNSAGEAFRRRIKAEGEAAETGRLMSEQFAGVALVLDGLAEECAEGTEFGGRTGRAIGDELLRHNIVAGEILVGGEGESTRVSLSVREEDADKLVLPRIVSAAVGTALETVSVTRNGEGCVVHLAPKPLYEVAYGVAEKKREGEKVSGDSHSVLCPSRRRRLFALSDGMGSGEAAARASADAVAMVENFYRAGIDPAVVLTLVNKLLCLTAAGTFSSIDISVVDTVTGELDIIKMGAASTFVGRVGSLESVACEAPPAGILESARPLTLRRQLYDGDTVIMMSDGVFDALGERGVAAAAEDAATSNPQVLADKLLERAAAEGASDDCTVLVMRLYAT